MNFNARIKDATINLTTSKLRSFLAVLGVLVGVASVVALVSGGQLATAHALSQLKALGTDLLSVTVSPSRIQAGSGQQQQLTLQDVNTIVKTSPYILQAAPYTTDYGNVFFHGHQLENINTVGATQDLQSVVKISLAKGRFISFLDKHELFCFIGSGVVKKLRQYGALSIVGNQIRMGTNYCTVIGYAKKWPENIFIYANLNQSLILPLETSEALSPYAHINNIVFRLVPNANIARVKKAITDAINQLVPGQQIFFRSATELLKSLTGQRRTLTILLGLIGSISLIVGGIGVMNVMLVSVVERKREIGIRMAVGARRFDIQMMFLVEAVALTVFGGVIGVIIGTVVSLVIATFAGWGFEIFLLPPAIGFIVSALVGVFFGFYPAYKASRLDPIESLRAE